MNKLILLVFAFGLAITGFSQKNQAADKKTKASAKRAPIDTTKFVLVEGGSFMMGTDKPVEATEAPAHKVSVNSFYLAKTETTFEDYDKFTGDTKRDSANASLWGRGKQPALLVSWMDAVQYCNWLSDKEKLSKCYIINGQDVKFLDTAKGYRLPTEAEWEFAARGGNNSKSFTYSGSNDVAAVAWYKSNANRPMPVAQKAANELGLYDMTGNLWEWVWDIFDGGYYRTSPADNPMGPATGPYRGMRGGAWYNDPLNLRCVDRQNVPATFKQNSIGFRVARTYY